MDLPNVAGVEFREIPGFTGYAAGDDGSVWSCWKKGPKSTPTGKWRQRKTSRWGRGYVYVTLRNSSGNEQLALVHILVLESFIGPCPDGMQCRHIDRDTSNNKLSNIKWGTPIENAADKHRHGTTVWGESHKNSKVTSLEVKTIRSKYQSGSHLQRELAEEYGLDQTTIGDIVRGETWSRVS